MSAAPATVEQVRTAGTDDPTLRHILHKCDRDKPERKAYCGLKFKNDGVIRPFAGRTPNMCIVCMEFQGRKCPHCGE